MMISSTLWLIDLIAIFILCIVCAGFLIPQVLLIAYRKKLFDVPNDRKMHVMPVPRLGGLAFIPVILFSLSLTLGLSLTTNSTEIAKSVAQEALPLSLSFCAVMLLYVIGVADDLIGIKYRAKFVAQIIAGVLLVVGGLSLDELNGLLFLNHLPLWFAAPLTLFAVVFIVNAINLIDGIDGLASGLCGIAFVVYGVNFAMMNQWLYASLAAAALGVLIPFFCYNVFGNADKQKKIFMGDTGALTMGMCLCVLAMRTLDLAPNYTSAPKPFVLAFAPLLIPCMDVVRVYFRRVRHGNNPFLPDKTHIHHKLIAVGMGQRQAMITIITSAMLITAANCAASPYVDTNILLILDTALVTGINIYLTKAAQK